MHGRGIMKECPKCQMPLSKNEFVVWKCTGCGKTFKLPLEKLRQLPSLTRSDGTTLINCSNCGRGLVAEDKLYWKCRDCEQVLAESVRYFSCVRKNTLICPECNQRVDAEANICENCGFDLALYRQAYDRIYNAKIRELEVSERMKEQPQIVYNTSASNSVHKPRCPYCNSENLTRITSFDRAVNIVMFGLLGNKRKYQWHCNNCKTNW